MGRLVARSSASRSLTGWVASLVIPFARHRGDFTYPRPHRRRRRFQRLASRDRPACRTRWVTTALILLRDSPTSSSGSLLGSPGVGASGRGATPRAGSRLGPRRTTVRPRPYLAAVPDQPELLTNHCPCGVSWWGILRAHCCKRSGGCGEVFDDGELFDQHRLQGECGWPSRLGLVRNKGGIWHRRGDQAS
jgi:hypothetical protein